MIRASRETGDTHFLLPELSERNCQRPWYRRSVTYKYSRTGGDVDCICNVQFGAVDILYGDIAVMACAHAGCGAASVGNQRRRQLWYCCGLLLLLLLLPPPPLYATGGALAANWVGSNDVRSSASQVSVHRRKSEIKRLAGTERQGLYWSIFVSLTSSSSVWCKIRVYLSRIVWELVASVHSVKRCSFLFLFL